ncbi:MAG: hypothetical protein Q4A32_04135 [Lachnospiraceae bacterium]|nr:hypothetical protein [Lachnospiraceae bacterium]
MDTVFCNDALRQIRAGFEVSEIDIGKDRHLSKGGLHFATHSYEMGGAGHLCLMTMNAFWGLMRMESVVISPMEKDMPLFNIDWIRAFGKETLLIEIYDTQLEPLAEGTAETFAKLLERDSDLQDAKTKPHWYDAVRYPFSYGKTGKNLTERLKRAGKDYLEVFLRTLAEAPACDLALKSEKNADFALKLVANSGPAVDTMRGKFGEETMRRVVLRHMYGVEE